MSNPHPTIPPSMPPGGPLPDYERIQKRRTIFLAVAVAICAVAATFFGLFASGALRMGAEAPPAKSLQAKGAAPDPGILQKLETPPPPSLQKTAEAPAQMPADVEAWLKHLEKCEQMKVEITGDQQAEMLVFLQRSMALGAGMGLQDPYDQSGPGGGDQDPGTYTQGKILDLRPRWNELIQFYYSYPPPEECQPLADDFGRAINEIPGMMGDLGDVLNSIATSPEEALKQAQKLRNTSHEGIDRYFARADQKLGEICSKYNRNKWFNIKSDVGSNGIFSKSLMGGLGL